LRKAGVAALLVLTLLSGCASSRTGVVPWVNRPLPRYHLPIAVLQRYPTSAPPCRASQVRVTQGRSGAGLGNDLEELVFANVGARPCLLRGYPTIESEGRELHPQRGGTYFGQLVSADLQPRGRVFLDLATGVNCDNGRRPPTLYHRLVFTLPAGGRVGAPAVTIREVCGLSLSEFGLPERWVQPVAAPGSAGTLLASLHIPSRTRAGRLLRYTVTLRNPTTRMVDLHACPGYTEGLFTTRGSVERSYALNCDSVHAIPAGGRVRFAMLIMVPRTAPAGYAKLGWSLDTPTGPFTGTALQITPVRVR